MRKPIGAPKRALEIGPADSLPASDGQFTDRPAIGAGSTQKHEDPGSVSHDSIQNGPSPRQEAETTRSGQAEVCDATLLGAFETHLRLTENRSERTVDTYRLHGQAFRRYLTAHHPEVTLLGVETKHIRAYLLHEAARGLSPVTRAITLSAIKALFGYLVAEDLVSQNPAAAVRRPPGIKLRTEVYSEAEGEAILAWAASQPGRRWRVGHVILATFRYTGLRLSELVHLRLDQVDMEARRISLVGKGEKPRVVPIPPALEPVLSEYLTEIRPMLPASRYVFANPRSISGRQYHGRYGPRSVATLVEEAGQAAGVGGRHFPHRWRHSYATSLLRRGVDIHLVQRLLGHSAITTTTRYLHLDDTDLADAVDLAFPGFDD